MKKLLLLSLILLLNLVHSSAQAPYGYFSGNCSSHKAFACSATEFNYMIPISSGDYRKGILIEENPSNTCNLTNAWGSTWAGIHNFHPNTFDIKSRVRIRNMDNGSKYTYQISIYKDCFCNPIATTSKDYIASANGLNVIINTTLFGVNLSCGKYYLEFAVSRGDNKSDTASILEVTITPKNSNIYSLPSTITVNNTSNKVYNICASSCPYTFTVDPLPNGMCANYIWTIDGVEVSRTNAINFDRENPGIKQIFLIAQLGDDDTGVCAEELIILKVDIAPPAIKKGKDIYLCSEELIAGSYVWHNQVISQAGEYRARFQEPSNCCSFDSVVNFLELPIYALNPYYFVAKNNSELYYDQKIKTVFDGCNYNKYVNSKFTLQGRECDSAYLLTTLYPKLTSNLIQETQGNSILLKPNINNITDICKTGAKFDFKYSWAKRNAPGLVVGTDQNLLISSKEDYNLNVHANITLDGKEYPFDSLFKFNLLTGVVDQQLGNSFEPIIYCSNGKLDIYISKSASQFYPIMVELHTINGIVLEKQRFIEEHVSFDMGSYTNGIYYLCFIDWSGNGIARKVAFY